MKKWFGLLPSFVICIVAAAVIMIGRGYVDFISARIYEDSTDHLGEIYGQVNRSFGAFVKRNWGLLDNWEDYFALAGEGKEKEFADFITKKQDYWGFSEFYFFSGNGDYRTLDGSEGKMELGDSLAQDHEPVMTGQTSPSGEDITVFAVSVPQGQYDGFVFDSIAVSYTNADLASSLDVNAFSGQAKCFVIHDDGDVLLSTMAGGNVFDNYLVYLEAASDLSEEKLAQVKRHWERKTPGLFRCRIGEIEYCILYQPVGYQDYVLLSVVPQNVVSAGFLSVQRSTMRVLVIIFFLIGVTVVALLIGRSYRQSRKSQMELQYRERMFDVLSNSVDDIFLMLDIGKDHVDYVSPNIDRLLGIKEEEVRNNVRVMEKCAVNFNTVVPKEELAAIPLGGNQHWECEYIHQKTGERRWYRMTVYHMSIQEVRKYIIVFSDRTQEKQMNQQMQEALTAARSANEAKSNFLSNMSHDIRTPLNAIVGFSVLLERDAGNADKVREYTGKITASSHHLLSLINDVLDMSKIESGKTSLNVDRFSLPELLEELNIILAPQAKAKGQEFTVQVQGTLPEYLIGDKLRLNQILINLLSNAVKYTPEEGKIAFSVCELSRTQQYAKLRFIVKDNGIGMSKEFQKQIFMPFSREVSSVTNKIQGTGLGMAITKNLVDLMGGIIRVESQTGLGSTFTVELSFSLPEQEEAEKVQKEPEKPAGSAVMEGMLFLVAEDIDLNAEILKEMLKMEGADCELASNGKEALELFEQSEKGYYDMILMDVQMPVMNGYEATAAIRSSSHPDAGTIPIIAMTANTFAEDVRDALAAGMDAHVAKPINMDMVKEVIARLKEEKG